MSFPQNWDLESLLPDPRTPAFRQRVEEFKARLLTLVGESEALPPIVADPTHVTKWVRFLQEFASVEMLACDLRAHVECHVSADAANKQVQLYDAELSSFQPLREQITTNVEFALQAVSDADLAAWTKADPFLQQVQFYLQLRRKNAALRLPKAQELLAQELAVDGLHAWGRLYDRLSSNLKITLMERGKPVTKSPGQVQFDSPQRAVRENNFFAADVAWAGIEEPCAEAINHLAGTRLTLYKRLGLQDHLDVPLHLNRMSRDTLTSMWGTITEKKNVLKEYLAKKAELLGIDRMAWWDQMAPLPALPGQAAAEEISYDTACEWIIEAFNEFSPDFGEFAKLALTEKWVEAEDRAGKRQGGFCTGFPTAGQTRIFMTYNKTADNMATLAHELGHAYHSWVLRKEPFFLQDYPMNLAETASTFAEAVLGEARLRNATTAYERLGILEGMLGDAMSFLMNIHARFLFEDRFHQERRNGEVSAERLSELMVAAQKEAYLDSFAADGWNGRFWVSKMHFYFSGWPFYNFPYTFGYLLSLGIYAIGKEMGPEFPARYQRFLLATGAMSTEEAVRESFGYDLRQPDFWLKSLAIIERRVDQFLEVSDEVLKSLAGKK